MQRRHSLAAQAWYAISQGAPAFINPFLNLFFARIGLAPSQIGLLSALRPWISAPCGSIVAGLADRWGTHRSTLLCCYLAMTFIQGLMALPVFASFAAMLALTVLTSTVYTPAQIIADAAVMAASTHPGDYGCLRTWASISWTAFAPLAGWVNSHWGIRTGIICYVLGSLLAVPAAALLPVEALRRKIAPIIERRPSREPEEEEAAAAAELRQPLLVEEAPPTPAVEQAGLAKALAIIRYIEAITEMGVAPPAGAGMYGYASLPLGYASQHLAPHQEESLPASPGYSPFAGAQEPGSVCPGLPTSDAGAAPPAAPSSPSAAQQRPIPSATAPQEEVGEGPVHGSSLALSSLLQQPASPRPPPTLPRPISVGELGRVASLAHGIPRVRTRTQLASLEQLPAASEVFSQDEEGEEAFSPSSGDGKEGSVVLVPHSAGRQQALGEQQALADDDVAAGAVFPADDLPTTHTARTASAMLRDVRGVQPPPPQPGGAEVAHSDELPVSVVPSQAAADADGGGGEAVPAVALDSTAAATPATPAFRSAALQRLAQVFSSGRRGGSTAAGEPAGGSQTAAEQDEEAGLSAATPAGVALSPVRCYIDYRQARCLARREQRRAAAAAEGREPEPPTSLPASAAAFAGTILGSITPSFMAATGLEAAQRAYASPALMREALDAELLEAAAEHDPTGTLIVGMLSKKLERMAAEARRQQRLRRRAARKAAAAAAAAAPPAGPEARAAEEGLAGVAEGREGVEAKAAPSVMGTETAVEEALSFDAALKRLLSDPQVSTFFFLTVVLGFGHGIVGIFLFMYLSDIGGTELLMGWVLMANALPELPAFFFFGRILSTLGMNTVLLAAAGTLGLRIWAYSLLPAINLNWIIPIEALHALTYACGWSASAVNSSKIAPPGLESTTQAIFQGLWTGVGCGVAGLLGGFLFGSHGAPFLFRLSGLAILGSTAAAAVVVAALRWRRKRRPELLPSGESLDKLSSLAGLH